MKPLAMFVAACCLLSFSPTGFAAPDDAPSDLSGFRGNYSGRMQYSVFGSSKANATIVAQRNRERGKISTRARLVVGPETATIKETIRIRGGSASYLFEAVGSGGAVAFGTGTARVSRNIIRYNATFNLGGTAYFLQGIIRKDDDKLKITDTILGGPTPIPITYTLTKNGE